MHKDCCAEGLHASFYKNAEVWRLHEITRTVVQVTHRNTLKLSSSRYPCTNSMKLPLTAQTYDHMGVSENRGRECSTLNSRILIIIRTPKHGAPNFRKLPHAGLSDQPMSRLLWEARLDQKVKLAGAMQNVAYYG